MNVKDIISAVVTSMKVDFSAMSIAPITGGTDLEITGVTTKQKSKMYIGLRFKLTVSTGEIYYGKITSFDSDPTQVNGTLDTAYVDSADPNATWSLTQVLVFDHGHRLEIVNKIKEYTQHDTLKFESFPRVCLFHDFEEKESFETQVTLDLVIVTDTDPAYSSAERYTYSFDPILTPLYDLFIKQLSDSLYIQSTEGNYYKHTQIHRLFWGKSGLYGNEGNIFNDYIDAIEIANLELIISNC
jgi:hypothetical protein